MGTPPTLAEAMVSAFKARGVERLFGVPGGGSSLDLIDAAGRQGLDFVLTRGETAAALMASVTAELTGAPGVVLTGIGPGAASVVNGVAYAALEQAPLLVITDAREPDETVPPHQVFDQGALFAPFTKGACRLTPDGGLAALDDLLERALAAPRGPVHIDLSARDAGAPVDAVPGQPAPRPAQALAGDPGRARDLLGASRRPVVIAGTGARARGVGAALARLTEALACPLLTSYKAKGVVADRHPRLLGHFTGAAVEFANLAAADLIVAVGLEPVELIPAPWRSSAPLVVLAEHDGARFPVAAAARLLGPLAAGLEALTEAATPSAWTADEIAARRRGARRRLHLDGRGHTAQTVTEALVAAAPGGTRLTVDSGAHMFSAMALWPARAADDVLKSNGLSTMGFALPAAIASALAEPQRPVVALTGDGGLMMCLAELSTAAALGCRLTVVVLNDAALSLIDIKQQRQQRPPAGVRLPATDFAAAARGLGCRAWRVGANEDLAPALAAAFAEPGPSLVDVAVDPSGYGAQLAALRG